MDRFKVALLFIGVVSLNVACSSPAVSVSGDGPRLFAGSRDIFGGSDLVPQGDCGERFR